jgi:hypothetical protein
MTTFTIDAPELERAAVAAALAKLDSRHQALIAADGVRYRVLARGERFGDVARCYRTADSINVGLCLGLYAPDERLVILRDVSAGVVVHESLHHIDFRGGSEKRNVPRSLLDPRFRTAFERHRRDGLLVSAYAGVNVVEFFAETARCAHDVDNGQTRTRMTPRARLLRIDPQLLLLVDELLEETAQKYGDASCAAASDAADAKPADLVAP